MIIVIVAELTEKNFILMGIPNIQKIILRMKLVLKVFRQFSAKSSKQTSLNIKIEQLIQKYQNQFVKQADLFQLPLSKSNSLLAYTNRFAKSVLNIEEITKQKKKSHFRKIKGSMLSNNKLTPLSCVQLCQSFVHFPFDGDQTKVLEMLRDYAEQSKSLFTSNEIDRFNLSYKYLMIDKLIGSIKFVNFQLKKEEIADLHVISKCSYLFRHHGVKMFNVKDWGLKKEIKFQINIGQLNRKIRIKGFTANLKAEQLESVLQSIKGLTQKNQKVILLKHHTKGSVITPQTLAKELLISSKNWDNLHEIKHQNTSTKFHQQSLILKLQEKIKKTSENVQVIQISLMRYLNGILSYSSEAALKELFGYLKFSTFHAQLEKLLHLWNIQKRKHLKQIFPLTFQKMLQLQQKTEFSYITPEWLSTKSLVDLIVQKDIKAVTVYMREDKVYQYLYFLLNYAKQMKIGELFDQAQNKNLNIVKNKLALSSVLYGWDLKMPVLQQNQTILRKALFPFTFQYRYQKNS